MRLTTSGPKDVAKIILCFAPLDLFVCPSYFFNIFKRGSRGGLGRGGLGVRNPPPPLRIVRGRVLCRGLMGRRRGPTVVFTLLLSCFSDSHYTNILHISNFNIQYRTVILFSIFLFLYEKNPTSHPLLFMKGHFHSFLVWKCTILHNLRPPLPNTFTYQNYHVIFVFMCREGLVLYKRPRLTENKLVCK